MVEALRCYLRLAHDTKLSLSCLLHSDTALPLSGVAPPQDYARSRPQGRSQAQRPAQIWSPHTLTHWGHLQHRSLSQNEYSRFTPLLLWVAQTLITAGSPKLYHGSQAWNTAR